MRPIKYLSLILLITPLVFSCLKQDFDEPPGQSQTVSLKANTTIKQLKGIHRFGQIETIDEELIIEGLVIANDQSGNFYRMLVIQDETAGIQIKIAANDLHNEYPIGRRLFIRTKGLTLGDFNGLIELGMGTYQSGNFINVAGIEEVVKDEFIFKGPLDQPLEVRVKSIEELKDEDISTLVNVEDVQFAPVATAQPYADAEADPPRSVNRMLEDCHGNTIILRSSGYANFAREITPEGRGRITAIFSVFGKTKQLFIRNLEDIDLAQPRCEGAGSTSGEADVEINEDFESAAADRDIELSSWMNINQKGERRWQGKSFDGNSYAQATAFQDDNPQMIAWLITPAIDLQHDMVLRFQSAKAFWAHDGLSVWASTDFNGTEIETAQWVPLEAQLADQTHTDHAWIDSGDVDLSQFSGKIYIAFRYEGRGGSQTTSFRIDNVQIRKK